MEGNILPTTNEDNNVQFEDPRASNNTTIYILLFVVLIICAINTMELYHVYNSWIFGMQAPAFEGCIKYELITKTCFSIFSFLAPLCVCFLIFFILLSSNWVIDKLLPCFLYFIYLIFGPYMLGCCIIGFYNWSEVVYICDKQNNGNKIFSQAVCFTLIICVLVSLSLTLMVSIYETVSLYTGSVMRKPNGSAIIRKTFWWVALKNRSREENGHQSQNC
jgi:hypothetical protein